MNVVEKVLLRNLNVLFKLVAGAAVVLVALSLRSLYYNLAVILGVVLLVKVQRIRLVRFRSLYFSLGLFLGLLFLFRLFPGTGKVLWEIPGGLTLTSGGLHQALLSVETILLVFLVFGAALYSSSREEIAYYLQKIPTESNRFLQFFSRMGQITLFAFFLLPIIFERGKTLRGEFQKGKNGRRGWKAGLEHLGERLGDFFVQVLKRAEAEYPAFQSRVESSRFQPIPLFTSNHALAALFLVAIHSVIWWIKS